MSKNCSHNCAECGADCGERTAPQSLLEKPNPASHVKKVIGVVSGKGGVGKSLVTSLLAAAAQRHGFRAAILDADVTGPSIPRIFGVHDRAAAEGESLLPAQTPSGLKIMSVNLLLEHDSDPVIWRGPIIAGVVKQFWTDVAWGDVDYMFVDMPPGTGDVPLTVFQSLPVDGIIVVSSPQELVEMIVAKAVKMAGMMQIPVLGLVENMSYFVCPACHERHEIFGESRVEELAARFGIDTAARIPILPELAGLCDNGRIEEAVGDWLDSILAKLAE